MKKLFSFVAMSVLSVLSVNVSAQTLTAEGLTQICATQGNGSQMVNLTNSGVFMFLTDANGVTHRTFIANEQEIDFSAMNDFWQKQVIDGLKSNYDVIACVSASGKIISNLGILTATRDN